MARRRKSGSNGPALAAVAFLVAIFAMFFHMMFKTKGPWRWIFLGLFVFAVVSYTNGWGIGEPIFFVSAPILCWVSDYLTSAEPKVNIPIIIAGSVIWATVYFAFLF